MKKTTQYFMLWFLPLIVIGGIFVPALGYLVIGMMVFFLVLSYFKQRFWCWHLCPRGSFLDVALSRVSLNRPLPRLLTRPWFRWLVFAGLMAFLSWRLILAGASVPAVGSVFVGMCILTTVIAVVLGILTKHRAWCMICPMGNLQEQIGKLGKKSLTKD